MGGTRGLVISGNRVTAFTLSDSAIQFIGDNAGYTVEDNYISGEVDHDAILFPAEDPNYPTINGGGTINRNRFENNHRGISFGGIQ